MIEGKYKTVYAGGAHDIGEADIEDLEGKIIIKSSTIPTASADTVGEVRQYVGTTNATYTHGYIYECVQGEANTITFTPANIACSGTDFMAFLADVGSGTNYNSVVQGTMTYSVVTDLWVFVGKNSEGETVVSYQEYTQDFVDAGFTFLTTPEDGDEVTFVRTTTATYDWERVDVQPGGSRGRFLAIWNCTTGLAESNPPTSPFEYATGDYFIVGTVGATNYKPNGGSYIIGTASTTVETNEVKVDDTYYFDGTNWKLQSNTNKTVTFASIVGNITDNTSAATALNTKQDTSNLVTSISSSSTDTQYPSAKCVYDIVGNIETLLQGV